MHQAIACALVATPALAYITTDICVHILPSSTRCVCCYNSESSRPKGLVDSVCARAGDGQPYLAQGSSMQRNRRNQTQCACEAIEEERVITNRVAYLNEKQSQ